MVINKLIISSIILLSIFLSGCTSLEPNMVWSGRLVDMGVSDGHTFVVLDTKYGMVTKIWNDEYPIIDSLVKNETYSFHSYTEFEDGPNSSGTVLVPPKLLEVRDEYDIIIWSV